MAVHIYTQTIHRTTQITTEQHKRTSNVEDCGPCPVFASCFCLTTEEKARKNFSQSKKTLSRVKKSLSHSTIYILPKHPHITNLHKHTRYKTHTYTHIIKQYKTTTVQIKTNSAKYTQMKSSLSSALQPWVGLGLFLRFRNNIFFTG